MIIGKIRDKINDKTDNNTVTVENLTERKTSIIKRYKSVCKIIA